MQLISVIIANFRRLYFVYTAWILRILSLRSVWILRIICRCDVFAIFWLRFDYWKSFLVPDTFFFRLKMIQFNHLVNLWLFWLFVFLRLSFNSQFSLLLFNICFKFNLFCIVFDVTILSCFVSSVQWRPLKYSSVYLVLLTQQGAMCWGRWEGLVSVPFVILTFMHLRVSILDTFFLRHVLVEKLTDLVQDYVRTSIIWHIHNGFLLKWM